MSGAAMPSVKDITVDNLSNFHDARGTLIAVEFNEHPPFPVVRLFYIRDVPPNTVRGEHAHRLCRQYMICQAGRLLIEAADATQTRQIELHPGQAVFIERGIFTSETYLDRDTVLLVLCDRPYEKDDYIRTRAEFLETYSRR